MGLLPLAEKLRGVIARRRVARANARYCDENPGIRFPPPKLYYMGGNDYAWYWNTGRVAAKHILDFVLKGAHGVETIKVLEWGCGPARIIRHIPESGAARGMECHGTDYDAGVIEWCRGALKEVKFQRNGLTPPLDFEAGYFDFVYCISVFTHLSEEMHHAWLSELLRITKPGGRILMSLHGPNYRGKLFPDELKRFDNGELVIRGNVHEGSRMYGSFHGERFVREQFLRGVDIEHEDHRADNPIAGPQSVWIVRKRTV